MTVSIDEFTNSRPIGALQWRVFVLCALVLVVDGYDLAALSFVVPRIGAEWGVPASSLGLAFSSALVGAALGSVVAGWLGDRIGRRLSLLGMLLLGATSVLLTAYCESIPELILCRFLSGIGIGGTIPNALALASEYAPRARRTLIVVAVVTSASVGSTIGSLTAHWVIATWGWRGVFYVGGAIAFLVALCCWKVLPESLQWLVATQRDPAKSRQICLKLAPELAGQENLEFMPPESNNQQYKQGKLLFAGRLAIITPLLWFAYMLGQSLVLFLTSWLPTLLTTEGHDLRFALYALTMLHAGGLVGGLLAAWLGDRLRPEIGLVCIYGVGVPTLAALAHALDAPQWLPLLAFLAGLTVIGPAACLSGLASACYPPRVLATGLGTAYGIGRIGAIVSPAIGGFALAAAVTPRSILMTSSLVIALAATVVGSISLLRKSNDPVPEPRKS
jgi:AAHS family 4-hydroxybenzoate transporter-like MFS transporter